MKTFSLDLILTTSIFVVTVISLLAIFFTSFIYRKTNPVIEKWQRILLITIRSLVLVILIFIVFEATVGIHITRTEKPTLAVAIDNSASMGITDPAGSRPQIIKSALNSLLQNDNETHNMMLYTFDSQLKSNNIDSLILNGDVTNISNALNSIKQQLLEKNLAGIVLVSDGNYNQGGNPQSTAEQIGVPVYTVGIGSSDPIPDISITNLRYNSFAYTDEQSPIEITITNNGFPNTNSMLNFKLKDSTITTQKINLQSSPSEKSVELKFTPKTSGRKKLVVELLPLQNEESAENNKRTFYIDVLKSRLSLLLIAGQISPEISFLRRHLSSNDRYDLNVIIENRQNIFLQPEKANKILEKLADVDIFIFQEFPAITSSSQVVNKIFQSLSSKQRSIVLLVGAQTDFNKLIKFEQFVPIKSATRGPEKSVFAHLSPAGKTHSITQLQTQSDVSVFTWNKLAPIFYSIKNVQLWPNAEILAYANPQSKQLSTMNTTFPLIVTRINGNQKSSAILGYGIWRWDLMMKGLGHSENSYHQLINHLTRWVETARTEDLVRLSTDQDQYSYGEPVDINVQVFNTKLEPVTNAQVTLELNGNNYTDQFFAQNMQDGSYSVSIQPEQPGDYKITARATRDSQSLGVDTSMFTVGAYHQELNITHLQENTLKAIAKVSGGQYIPADSTRILANIIKGEPVKKTRVTEKELWNHPLILIIIIFLLSTEWFIRKRRGMV